jgi:PTS system N-acetylglucosamine-specific IIC component
MLPIAVLPVAGLLLRLGQPDLLDIAPIAAAGDAIFSNLGLLFAVGIAVGLARENHGAAGLAGLVGFFVATKGAEVLISVPPDVVANLSGAAKDAAAQAYKAKSLAKLSVPIGIISGILAGWLYNRYGNIKLPAYLAFFGGRRFVPIAAGGTGLALAFVFGLGWPVVEAGMDTLSRGVIASGEIGLFVYGVLNRLLIVTGLHHILNNVAWFIVGDFNGATGDLKRFFAGDPSAGVFMSGFFPVMMFGLPAACLAMYRTAAPERRRDVGGLMASMALTSFLTGVTEPIEFTFMFLAPWLYALHAVLTGAAMVTMDLLGVRLGFGFSAGLFDYALNFNKSTHPLYLIPVGAIYFALYYFVFRWCIVRFGLKTPGREGAAQVGPAPAVSGGSVEADAFILALGGAANLAAVDACANRESVDEAALKRLGVRGTVRVGAAGLQVVVGPVADLLAGEIRARLRSAPAAAPSADADGVLAGLGGRGNVKRVECAAGRLLVTVDDAARVDERALGALGARGVARASKESVHVLHPEATALGKRLEALLAG